LEWTVKKKYFTKKRTKERDRKVEGIVYEINCKDCDKVNIGETKFKLQKRIGQHKKDV